MIFILIFPYYFFSPDFKNPVMKEVMKIGKEEGMNIECLSIVLYWMILYLLLVTIENYKRIIILYNYPFKLS